MKFARAIFWIAGAYGLTVILPQYFLLERIGHDLPPAVTHAEYFYGFLGVAAAWQIAFWVIGYDPPRYRPIMLVGVFEKVSFAIAVALLFVQRRVAASTFAFGRIDLALAGLFVVAWRQTPHSQKTVGD